MPILGYRYPSILYAFIVISLFLLLSYDVGAKTLQKIIPIFLIPLLDVFISSVDAYYFFQGISRFLQFLILPLLAIHIYNWNDIKMAKLLLLIYLGINFITCFTTYNGCMVYPEASRELAAGDASSAPFYYLYMDANIGGFHFIYSTVLISGLIIYTIKNFRYIKGGYILLPLCIVYLGLIFMTLLAAEYTLSVLMFVSYVFLLFVRGAFSIKNFFLLSVFIILSFLMLKPLISNGLKSLSEATESEHVASRLYDLHLKLEGNHTQKHSDYDSRKETYIKSIEQFEKKLLGCWNLNGMGGHSFVLDSMAKYGLLGLILVVISNICIYRYFLSPYENDYIFGYVFYIFILYIVASVLNPIIFTNIIMFVFPLYKLIFQENSCDYNEFIENDLYK